VSEYSDNAPNHEADPKHGHEQRQAEDDLKSTDRFLRPRVGNKRRHNRGKRAQAEKQKAAWKIRRIARGGRRQRN
jgi:hypothetical protein